MHKTWVITMPTRNVVFTERESEKRESDDFLCLNALQNAVQVGLADSAAGRYTSVDSRESLKTHLKSLAAMAIATAAQTPSGKDSWQT
jgi:hypothetical protein